MCKAPKQPKQQEPKKPQFLRNTYLDAFMGESQAVNSLRSGRSSFRIDLGGLSGIGGRATRQPGTPLAQPPANQPQRQVPFAGIIPRIAARR